jgi:hypothetical protein
MGRRGRRWKALHRFVGGAKCLENPSFDTIKDVHVASNRLSKKFFGSSIEVLTPKVKSIITLQNFSALRPAYL